MKHADETPPTGAQVLAVFAELTGIEFRRPSEDVKRQATTFGETWTFAELEAVIEFMRWQQKHEKCPYNDASYGWTKLMGTVGRGDEFVVFEERLGIAREAVRRKTWFPKLGFRNNDRITAAEAAQTKADAPKPVSDEERARLAADARRHFEQLKL